MIKPTLRIEIRDTLKKNAASIISERIFPTLCDMLAEEAGAVMGKLTNLDGENAADVDKAFTLVYERLIGELCNQIEEKQREDEGKNLRARK